MNKKQLEQKREILNLLSEAFNLGKVLCILSERNHEKITTRPLNLPGIIEIHSAMVEAVDKLTEDEKKEEQFRTMEMALEYICWVANKKNPHLGHPRLSDKDCIFCNAYFAIPENNGGYGYTVDSKYYLDLIEALKNE